MNAPVPSRLQRFAPLPALAAAMLFLLADPAHAYIGPGAGFALASSFFVVFLTAVAGIALLLVWPFRKLWQLMTRKKPKNPLVKRLLIVGFDGQDTRVTEKLMAEGKLPNLKALADEGTYRPLATSYPSITPVAWSTFATGVQPGKHNIFDFLDRDRRSYLPILSSVRIGSVDKTLKLGKWRIPLSKPELTLMRKSKPWWSILGERSVWSTIIRVPISFPPDKFYGAQLGAMSIPDLLGTQGTFLLFTTRSSDDKFKEGGIRLPLSPNGSATSLEGKIQGPENTFLDGNPPLEIPLKVKMDKAAGTATLELDGESITVKPGDLTDWVTLQFPAAPGVKVSGLCRMMVTEMDEHFSLYMTPISIDPEKPAMPISHPSYYSTYLAKKVGPFSTMGLAEDTWALNEQVTKDKTFWDQTIGVDDERREMFFAGLDRLKSGALVCVFDGVDRVQHMYWRYMEDGHPAQAHSENAEHVKAIEDYYIRNDKLVGQIRKKVKKGDLLMVISDHGFTSFRRGVNLNRWFLDNGYMKLKEGADGSSEWLQDVDWENTRAYALGLSGIFLNIKGREAKGTVEPGDEAEALKAEIMEKLQGLRDEEAGEVGINEGFDTNVIYNGPYKGNAPDVLIGYNHGYRASWDCASGVVNAPLFEDNIKAWSGDHCVDPRIVPGVFFCNRDIDVEDPALMDIAPTALRLFGVDAPDHMEGKPLFEKSSFGKGK